MIKKKEYFLNKAHIEALKAFNLGEVPVGAVAVLDNKIIAKAHNIRESSQKFEDHAEFIAMKKAAKKINSWRLENVEIYVTLEPCPMCAGAMIQSRVKKCYFASYDLKNGAVSSIINMFQLPFSHKVEWEYLSDNGRSSNLLKSFFKNLRK